LKCSEYSSLVWNMVRWVEACASLPPAAADDEEDEEDSPGSGFRLLAPEGGGVAFRFLRVAPPPSLRA